MKTPKQTNRFMFFLLIYSIILPQVLAVLFYKLGIDTRTATARNILLFIQDIPLFAVPIAVALLFAKIPFKECCPHSRLSGKNIVYIILLTLTFLPCMLFIGVVSSTFFGSEVSTELISYTDGLPLVSAVIAMALMPAIFEELTFRGLILGGYRGASFTTAIIVSGLFFGMIHLNLYQFFYSAVGGMYFAFLVYYTNSIYSSMLAHFVINGLQVITAKLTLSVQPESVQTTVATTPSAMEQLAATSFYAVLAIIFLPIFIMLVKRFAQHNSANAKNYRLSVISEDSQSRNIVPRYIDIWFVLIFVVGIIYLYMTKGIV